MFTLFKKKEKIESFTVEEKDILCNLVEKYIEIATANDTTLDDYISIIALIIILQKQYPEYLKNLQYYIDLFDKKGILEEYEKNSTNTPKKIFSENHFESNVDLAEKMLYSFFEGCTRRPIHFLIIIGLCGRPITPKQKYIMARIFEGNYYSFYQQKRYYSILSLNDPYDNFNFSNKSDKILYENANNYSRNKEIAIAFQKEKNDKKYEEYMLKAEQYNVGANEDLFRFYMRNGELKKAKECLDKLEKKYKENKDGYNYYIKPLVEFYNYKIKYPYLRKDILEKFNIDIKTFNEIIKPIKDNIEYKCKDGYSEKAIEYLTSKLNN